jgi:hypothetical protein
MGFDLSVPRAKISFGGAPAPGVSRGPSDIALSLVEDFLCTEI